MVGPARPVFVLFGSSHVHFSYSNHGWGAILADIYARKADILLRGYAGWNSRQALQVLDQIFPKDALVQPSLVIVYFGGNDSKKPNPSGVGPHVPLAEYIENMKKIATHLKSLSDNIRLIFLTCPPINEEQLQRVWRVSDRTNEVCEKYAEACVQVCKELDVKCVNLWTAIQEKEGWLNTCFRDGIHLSVDGSKIVAKEILKAIKEAEWEPDLYWRSMEPEFSEEDSGLLPVGADGKQMTASDVEYLRNSQWE